MLIELLAVGAIISEQGQPSDTPNIVDPEWALAPTPSWPRGANEMRISRGEIITNCLAGADGRISDCRVEEEKPGGYGFAREVLASTSAARLNTSAEDFVVGARVQFTVRFEGALIQVATRLDDE